MLISMLKSKLHRAVVTEADLNYEGSITVDIELLEQAGILPYEQVDVLNITNGARFTTYTITAPKGSRKVCVNGAAARLVQKGDLVIICSYVQVDRNAAKSHTPTIILLDENNNVKNLNQ
jgi:aspartate 1-decarboxylase